MGKNFKKERKMHNVITENTVKCKCSHSHFMPVYLPYKVCSWCGRMVFRNKEEEFKYKLQSKLKK